MPLLLLTFFIGRIYPIDNDESLNNLSDIKNTIIVGWDAAQRNHVYELLDEGKLPNLKEFVASGSIVDMTITTGATSTKPGWAEVFTGYSPKIMGVSHNFYYKPIPKGYTIFERLEDYFGKENIVTAFISGKRHGIGARGPHEICLNCIPSHRNYVRDISEKDVEVSKENTSMDWWEMNGTKIHMPGVEPIFAKRDGEPYYYTKDAIDIYATDLGGANNVTAEAMGFLNTYKDKRLFAFFHFGDADTAGHEYGEYSNEYSNAIIMYDQWLGSIISKLKELKIWDKTLLYVTADHGFDEGGKTHENAPDFFLATNNKQITKNGDRKDITPTILWSYGFDLGSILPPLDGSVLVDKKLMELNL